MLVVNKVMAWLGLVLLALVWLYPMLQVKIIFEWVNWGLYQVDIRLFLITYSLISFTALCFFVRQLKAFRLLTRVMFCWILLMAVAVYLKSTHYTGIKLADNLLGKAIHFQWGWIMMGIGAVLLLFSVNKR